MLSEEQIEQIKSQLISQIESTFPEDKKQQAIAQIESMDDKQLEQFLIQNKLIAGGKKGTRKISEDKCIFCLISSGESSSFKIDENKEAVAVLEINPISNGHALIIPREHISSGDKFSKSILSLAKKVSKKIKTKLKPKDVLIHSANLFGHEIINLIPVYKNESAESERKPAEKDNLEKLKTFLEKKPKAKDVKVKKITKQEERNIILPKRIP